MQALGRVPPLSRLPTGWTTMGEIAVGDLVLAADGAPTEVVAATEVMTGRPCYEVVFDDGTVIVADAQHQWALTTGEVRTSEQLVGGGARLHGPGA